MNQDSEQTSGRGGLALAALTVFVPVLCVLSIGPVVAVTKSKPGTVATVQAIYYPVRWLHEHTALKKPLEAYARFWGFD